MQCFAFYQVSNSKLLMLLRRISFISSFVLFSLTTFAQIAMPTCPGQYIDKVLDTFEVPELSVSIVKDGNEVLAKGYGVKKMGTDDKVDVDTLFSIASNSKAFTGTNLALVVEVGSLILPIRIYY